MTNLRNVYKMAYEIKLLKFYTSNRYSRAFILRVVQIQAILCLKSMSERGGSDIEPL